jgi:hypothetical protein
MLPAELDAFLKATYYTPAISPTTKLPFQSISVDAPWWRPQDAQRFEAGENFVDGNLAICPGRYDQFGALYRVHSNV